MNMKHLIPAILTLTFFSFTALAQKGGVAVLDIDAVARELGVEQQVQADLEAMQNQLNADLQSTQSEMQNQMNSVEQAAGEEPSEEKRREILATNQQLNAEFNRLKTQAQQQIVNERQRLINEFRMRLEPVALMAAKQEGLDVVLMKVTPPVFAYVNQVDITEATTKLAIEAGMKIETPSQPSSQSGDSTNGNGNGGGPNGGGGQGDSGGSSANDGGQ